MKLALLLVLGACRSESAPTSYRVATGGDPELGQAWIEHYGCAACHSIPGVRAPGGRVGPPLATFARRTYIAGQLPNTPENLIQWLIDPHAVEPRTAMPTMGLTEKEARDVAAYLYSLD